MTNPIHAAEQRLDSAIARATRQANRTTMQPPEKKMAEPPATQPELHRSGIGGFNVKMIAPRIGAWQVFWAILAEIGFQRAGG